MWKPARRDNQKRFSQQREKTSFIAQRAYSKRGNPETYQTVTASIGEHAGVVTERNIIRFKCTKCKHIWIDYSG